MNSVLKRFLSVILVITILISSAYIGLSEFDFGSFVAKAKAANENDLIFSLNSDGKSYSVTDYNRYSFHINEIVIPNKYNGLPVTGIGNFAFGYCDTLTSVTIPDSVTGIGSQAFDNCTKLSSITIPDSLTDIGWGAFRNCSSLTSITLPNNVTSIDDEVFCNCTSLTSIIFGDGITSIGKAVFDNTGYYNDINNWENDVLYINEYLVGTKPSLSGLYEIKPGTKTISENAFHCCSALTSIIIPNSVKNISSYAFSDCTGLTSIAIPNSVTNIGAYAFSNCTGLTSITIPDSVVSIGKDAFECCWNLASVYITDLAAWCEIDFENRVANPLYNANKLHINGELTTDIVIPDGVTKICDYAFSCENIVSVTIPDSVTHIGSYAFSNCESLTSITIPESITSIGEFAFFHSALTSVTIPDSVTNIGDYVFYCCYNLTSVVIGNGVANISGSAFERCTNLTSVTIPNNVITIGNYAFADCYNLTSVTIPDSVTSIGDYAFSNCYGDLNIEYGGSKKDWEKISIGVGNEVLDNISFSRCWYIVNDNVGPYISYTVKADNTIELSEFILNGNYDLPIYLEIPEKIDGYTVTSIADNLFKYNGLVYSAKIPNTVKSIGYSAFYNCYNLREIKLPNSLTEIKDYCFQYCMSLSQISIPRSVTKIGSYAFGGCAYSPYVNYAGSVCEWKNINIGTGNTSLDNAEINYVGAAHVSSGWIVDKSATVNATGLKYKECTVCGKTLETAVISQLKPTTPKLSSVTNATSGVKFTWGKVTGADSYVVYRRTYNASTKKWGGWVNIAKGVKTTSYVDSTAKSGTYYIYTVKATNEAGYSGYNTTGLKTYFLSTPKLSKIENTSTGVKVTWAKVTGATSYNVYRKVKGASSWTYLANTKGVSYTDKTAKSGTTYYYTVRAKYYDYVGAYNTTGLGIKYLAIPKLSKVENVSKAVKITWTKVTGAEGYYVYRKAPGETAWKKIATVKGNTNVTYKDTKVSSGKIYTYSVKAYSGSTASYYASSLKLVYLAAPTISKVENVRKAVKITWTKVTGAEGYYVYRKAPGETAWKKIATIKGNTNVTYKDTKVSSGKTYTYSVKAYAGSTASYYASSLKLVYLAVPTLTKVTSTTSGVKFTWGKVAGAEGYYVYRKTGSGSWTKIATVKSGASYLDKSAKKGTTYYYTVKAFKGSRTSYYNTTGLKVKDKY